MITWLPVIVASIINLALGFLWYGPFFGKPWRQMMGMSMNPEDYKMDGAMKRSMLIAFVLALVSNFVYSHVITVASMATGVSGVSAGISSGIVIWLGFVLIAQSGMYVWEGKPLKLWAIHSSYYLTLLVINGALLGWWM